MTFRSFPKRANKYGAKRSKCLRQPAHNHASALEANVCNLLLAREQAGECKLIQAEKTLYLGPARICYRADFWLMDLRTGVEFFAEAKGQPRSGRWPDIRKNWKAFGLGRLEVYTGDWKRPRLLEVLMPKGEGE